MIFDKSLNPREQFRPGFGWSHKLTFNNEDDFLSFEATAVSSRAAETMTIILPTHFSDE